jgi:hypothetical protein
VYIYNIVDMGWYYVLIGNIIISKKLYVICLDGSGLREYKEVVGK